MNYSDITTLAMSYADREDTAVSDRIDNFLKIVESRINRKLKTMEMSVRYPITVDGSTRYDLPSDFAGLRDIQLIVDSSRKTMVYASPEAMTGLSDDSDLSKVYYTIVADQLEIATPPDSGTIEIVYYQRVPALTDTATTNWVSDNHPDCYTFGLLVEINSFVKDAEAKVLWDGRFKEALEDMSDADQKNRWSGPQLITRIG